MKIEEAIEEAQSYVDGEDVDKVSKSQTDDGQPCIVFTVNERGAGSDLPVVFEGVPVVVKGGS